MANDISRMKELIALLNEANEQYYGQDQSSISDHQYDERMDELEKLERKTGIVFSSSPTKKVGSAQNTALAKVKHSKPMLSAQKTKDIQVIHDFINSHEMVLSWKLDGLTIVLRYKNGKFVQALTRGEKGLFGEDITHSVRYLRGIPKTVKYKEDFEVRGEGVISYADFKLLNRNKNLTTPRNTVSGAVRALNIDRYKLEHIDFVAFELIDDHQDFETKEEQLGFLTLQGFNVVDHEILESDLPLEKIQEIVKDYDPKSYEYPVDGLIFEFNDIAFGKGLGATEHHENRMMALKWADEVYETTFRGVEINAGKNGFIGLTALFDEVEINGLPIKKADLHSYSNFEKLELGIGDKIKVYLANMVVPEIEENLTRSGTYSVPKYCPCCGAKLETRISSVGNKQLYCPNESCISKNANKIARLCDSDALNIEGLSIARIETLLAYGVIKSATDLFHLEDHKEAFFDVPSFSIGLYEKLTESIRKSKKCHLYQFLLGMDIPQMNYASAKAIDDYFYGSYNDFEKAIQNEFCFFHISGVNEALHRNIYRWYKEDASFFKPLLNELSFVGKKKDSHSYDIDNKNIVYTGTINGMSGDKLKEFIRLLGANAFDVIDENTDYLLIGKEPNRKLVAEALKKGIAMITESEFAGLLDE